MIAIKHYDSRLVKPLFDVRLNLINIDPEWLETLPADVKKIQRKLIKRRKKWVARALKIASQANNCSFPFADDSYLMPSDRLENALPSNAYVYAAVLKKKPWIFEEFVMSVLGPKGCGELPEGTIVTFDDVEVVFNPFPSGSPYVKKCRGYRLDATGHINNDPADRVNVEMQLYKMVDEAFQERSFVYSDVSSLASAAPQESFAKIATKKQRNIWITLHSPVGLGKHINVVYKAMVDKQRNDVTADRLKENTSFIYVSPNGDDEMDSGLQEYLDYLFTGEVVEGNKLIEEHAKAMNELRQDEEFRRYYMEQNFYKMTMMGLYEELDEAKKAIATEKAAANDMKVQLDKANATIASTEARVDSAEAKFDAAKARADSAEAKFDAAKARADAAEARADSLNSQLAETKEELAKARQEYLDFRGEINELKNMFNMLISSA